MTTTLLAFWNGTPLFQQELNSEQEKGIKTILNEDFFEDDESRIPLAIQYLNEFEEELFQKIKSRSLKNEDLDFKTSVQHLLMINSLVNRGVVYSDDKTGLVWMKGFKTTKTKKKRK